MIQPEFNYSSSLPNGKKDSNSFTSSSSSSSSSSTPYTVDRVPSLVRSLVIQFINKSNSSPFSLPSSFTSSPSAVNLSTSHSSIRIDALQSYCLRIISSRILPSSTSNSLTHLIDLIKHTYIVDHDNSNTVNNQYELDELLQRFEGLRGIKEKWNLLYFLVALKDSNPTLNNNYQNNFSSYSQSIQTKFNSIGLHITDNKIIGGTLNNIIPSSSTLPYPSPSPSPSLPSPSSSFKVQSSSHENDRRDHLRSSNLIPESDLIRSLLYCFQGIDSNHLYFDASVESYRLISSCLTSISLPNQRLIHRIGELGGLYKRICYWINKTMEKMAMTNESITIIGRNNIITANSTSNNNLMPSISSSSTSNDHIGVGLIEQSLVGAIQEELKDYYRLIAILETQSNQSIQTMKHSSVNNSNTSSISADPIQSNNSHSNTFSLRRLYLLTQQSFHRLLFISSLASTCSDLKGSALLSHLFCHLLHGNPMISRLIRKIVETCLRPFISLLNRWLDAGELNDGYNEFFIRLQDNVPIHKWWSEKYELRSSMIPSFISNQLAKQILAIGKTVNFIRFQCNDSSFTANCNLKVEFIMPQQKVEGSSEEYDRPIFEAQQSSFLISSADSNLTFPSLDSVIADISLLVNNHLLSLLHHRYNIVGTGRLLKTYLLLSRGDFISHLLHTLHLELNKSSRELNIRHLKVLVDLALRKSIKVGSEEERGVEKLLVKLIKINNVDGNSSNPGTSGSGVVGWDVFCLDYVIDSPLNLIYTPTCMTIYYRLFNFLFRLKRVEYELVECWQRDMKYSIHIRKYTKSTPNHISYDTEKLLRLNQLIRTEMHHLIINLHSYLTFEVLDVAWRIFEDTIMTATSLDDILTAHNIYLTSILERSMLSGPATSLSLSLGIIFDDILLFIKLQDQIYQELNKQFQPDPKINKTIKQSNNSISNNSNPQLLNDTSFSSTSFQSNLFYYSKEIKRISEQFHTHICQFFEDLDSAIEKGQRGVGSGIHRNTDDKEYEMNLSPDHHNITNFSNSSVSFDASFSGSPTKNSINIFNQHNNSHSHSRQHHSSSLSIPVISPSSMSSLADLDILRFRLDCNSFYSRMRERRDITRQNDKNVSKIYDHIDDVNSTHSLNQTSQPELTNKTSKNKSSNELISNNNNNNGEDMTATVSSKNIKNKVKTANMPLKYNDTKSSITPRSNSNGNSNNITNLAYSTVNPSLEYVNKPPLSTSASAGSASSIHNRQNR